MTSIGAHFRRSVALMLLVAALVNLCLALKLAICMERTYLGQARLIPPLLILSFVLWGSGCYSNRAIYRTGLPT